MDIARLETPAEVRREKSRYIGDLWRARFAEAYETMRIHDDGDGMGRVTMTVRSPIPIRIVTVKGKFV